jgi:2,4-dienoyl-CoA reductase-like NADH-dependent reductase (Old Yellow Enzyme family)
MDQHAPFLEPGQIGSLQLRNRLVRAPTSETMAEEKGGVNDSLKRFYGDLGRGGAGLIITGHIFVEPRGQYSPSQMGIYQDNLVPGLKELVDIVHDAGGTIFAELSHAGSQSVMPNVTPVAPSIIPNAMFARTPIELSEVDIGEIIAAFGAAAGRAQQAGFDGIHLHGGNGYLLSEFASPHANRRDDAWGGDAERRGRFFVEVYQSVRDTVGDDFPISARVGIADSVEGGLPIAEGVALVGRLRERGLDAVETTLGVMSSYLQNIRPYVAVTPGRALATGLYPRLFEPAGPEAYYRPYAHAVKQSVDIPVILIGGMRTTPTMAEVISSGDADFIAMARPFIREPDIAKQIVAGRRGMVDCVSCNICLNHDGKDPLQCWRKKWRSLAHHAYCRFWRDR